jgi:hypothetical protein
MWWKHKPENDPSLPFSVRLQCVLNVKQNVYASSNPRHHGRLWSLHLCSHAYHCNMSLFQLSHVFAPLLRGSLPFCVLTSPEHLPTSFPLFLRPDQSHPTFSSAQRMSVPRITHNLEPIVTWNYSHMYIAHKAHDKKSKTKK